MFFVRKAKPLDYIDIANIHFTSWHATYSDLLPASYVQQKNNLSDKITLWQKLLSHPNVLVWLAYDSSYNNLGFVGYFTNNNNSYEITTLYVLPKYHGLGIGTALMNTSLQALSESNIHAHFHLWVLASNSNAINFYKKLGFVANAEECEELYESTKIIDIKMVKT